MRITAVGLGTWATGGPNWSFGWGEQDDRSSISAIRYAIDLGINWIDTAAVYGHGHAEEVIGNALAALPAGVRPYVFTKGGLVWNEREPLVRASRVGTSESIRRGVEASLRRLRVDQIDLYQMHWPAEDGTPLEDYWETFLDLKREGKVRAVGLSNHTAAQLAVAERLGHVDSLQPPFSAIRRGAAEAELPWCQANETGVIVYSPMQAGLLTGRFTIERAASLPLDDWRSRSAEHSGEKLRRNLMVADALGAVAERYDTTTAAIAVAWTLAWPGVTGAIVGARSPTQIDDWVGASLVSLNHEDMVEIARAIRGAGAGSGPTLPT